VDIQFCIQIRSRALNLDISSDSHLTNLILPFTQASLTLSTDVQRQNVATPL